MSGVPNPRAEEESSTVLSIVVSTLRRLEDTVRVGFDGINDRLSRLPNDYVPRREVERQWDLATIAQGAEEADRRSGDQALSERIDGIESAASRFRRWLVGTLIAGAGAAGAIGGVIESALRHH